MEFGGPSHFENAKAAGPPSRAEVMVISTLGAGVGELGPKSESAIDGGFRMEKPIRNRSK